MLELRNLTKTYRPQKGVPVQALKGIDLSFGETGLVFVLGKSGSGKSTLLNLIGGLDTADGGEIIIDGKSSRYFKASDYDAYRNTYIGFVFQEYNLLDDFTVGENISLALELQGQKADKQRLDEILKEVDLEGYADRKTNELSGGQKQRVAIARALVKNPKIIMADEPTGALDVATGKAILETLKRLSQDKLVIVVSHDREFAEEYGDRVIELADGEVIADTAKSEETRELSKEVENKGEMKKSRLPYKRALAMGAKTMRKKRLRLIVTILLCFVSFTLFGILDVGVSFDRDYTAQSALLLPNNDYISFSACINYKKGRWDWDYSIDASYGDLEKLRNETGLDFQGVLGDSYNSLPLWDRDLLNGGSEKKYYTGVWGSILPASQNLFETQGYQLYGRMPENRDEIVITKYIFDQFAIAGVSLSDDKYIMPEEINDIKGFLAKVPLVNMGYIVDYPYSLPASMTSRTIVGVVDTNADSDGRIKKMRISDEQYYSQICRQYFSNGYHSLTFVHQSLYDACLDTMLKPDTTGFGRAMHFNLHGINRWFDGIATDEAFKYTDKIVWLDGKGDRNKLADNEIVISLSQAPYLWPEMSRAVEVILPSNLNKIFIDGMVSFKNMSLYDFRHGGAFFASLCEEAEDISSEELEIYKQYCIENNYVFYKIEILHGLNFADYVELDHPDKMTENDWRVSYACYLSTDHVSGPGYITATGEVVDSYYVEGGLNQNVTGRKRGTDIKSNRVFVENRIAYALNDAQRDIPNSFELGCSGIYDGNALPYIEFEGAPKIVGIYYPKEGYPDNYVINNLIYEKSLDYEDMTYEYLIAPMPKDKETVSKIVDMHYDVSTKRGFSSNNVEFVAVNSVANPFDYNIPYLRIAGIIIGVFSVLLLGNYIAVSIASKKREIGILRALGARKSDIFAIFINECIIITAIVLILSILGLTIACAIYNSDVTSLGVQITVVHVGIRQIAIIFALGVGATLVASAVPLYKLSKKKPIDSISDR